jgi:hypothetical protein
VSGLSFGEQIVDINDLDDSIEGNVREFEFGELRRRRLSHSEKEHLFDETLGPRIKPPREEDFIIGDAAAGISVKSIWLEERRIHFATVLSLAVGEKRGRKGIEYAVDVNCTIHRSYRIHVTSIRDADNFLVALSRCTNVTVVPTVEEEMERQRQAEEIAAANESNAAIRQRRMELLAIRQKQLLKTLVLVESAPRISFGILF